MSLIFDRFPSRAHAAMLVADIEGSFGLAGQIFDDQDSAYEHDWFPYALDPPIVHIDRPRLDDAVAIEEAIAARVWFFGGEFPGT
jgi:hypothetical protein